MEYAIGYIVGVFVWAIIWGFAARAIAVNKGYEDEGTKWFWLGFFFSFIAVIIVATKQNRNNSSLSRQQTGNSVYEDLEKLAKLKEQGALTDEEYSKLKADCLRRM